VPDKKLLMYGALLAVLAAGAEVGAVYLFGVITDEALTARSSPRSGRRPACGWRRGRRRRGHLLRDCMTTLAG